MGDFCETFGEDAVVVARELDIVLTSRGRDKDGEKMPLAGVPLHAADGYVARLVGKGYRVAICDQVEDPKTAKGIVKRDVTRVVTPGTLIDPAMLKSPGARYLMAAAPDRKGPSALRSGCPTGEFFVSSGSDERNFADIISEVVRHRPTEAVMPEGIDGDLPEA